LDESEKLKEIERQLLLAAAVHGLGPATDLSRANTARVVNQVLRWRGRCAEELRYVWREQNGDPLHDEVYGALIRMTRQIACGAEGRTPERPGTPLFEGGGNWGVPEDPSCPACEPEFNSCRLTKEGQQLAQVLLQRHPEYCKG
jgi:hypothetical protein